MEKPSLCRLIPHPLLHQSRYCREYSEVGNGPISHTKGAGLTEVSMVSKIAYGQQQMNPTPCRFAYCGNGNTLRSCIMLTSPCLLAPLHPCPTCLLRIASDTFRRSWWDQRLTHSIRRLSRSLGPRLDHSKCPTATCPPICR